ncbi:hypothetical protein HC776_01755, partial [bacterium]|nr:hypothetical protein [bacterium]
MSDLRLPDGPPPVKNMLHMLMMAYAVSRQGPLALLMNLTETYGETSAFRLRDTLQLWTINADFAAEVTIKQASN